MRRKEGLGRNSGLQLEDMGIVGEDQRDVGTTVIGECAATALDIFLLCLLSTFFCMCSWLELWDLLQPSNLLFLTCCRLLCTAA